MDRVENRAVILGASRGLGAELAAVACAEGYAVTGWARKRERLRALADRHPGFEYGVADFSNPAGQTEVIEFLRQGHYDKLFGVAAGGPYGAYGERVWTAHDWAWQVSFVFYARVLHALAEARRFVPVILLGSAVAEASADPGAASYCAAKHALKGLIASLRAEIPAWDLRLFSPGYMDTEMLPGNAAARRQGVYSPARMARELWDWSLTPDIGGHKLYPRHPSANLASSKENS